MSLGVIDEPLQLAHNLTGSIIGMVHIMLPFLILPLYATMAVVLILTLLGQLWDLVQVHGAHSGEFFFLCHYQAYLRALCSYLYSSLGFFVTPALAWRWKGPDACTTY